MRDKILEIGKDSFWYFIAIGVASVLGFISIPVFTRIFPPYDYGIYSLVATTIVLVSPLFYVWLTTAIIRFYPEYEKRGELKTFYSTAYRFPPYFLVFFGFAILLFALFVPLGQYRTIVCLGIAIFALYTVFNVLLETMRARQMSFQYAVFYVLLALGRYVVGVALVLWFGMKVEGLLWGWLGIMMICLPIEFILLSLHKETRREYYSPALNRVFLSFGLVLIFSAASSNILTSADRYIVEAFKGATQVGLYSVVYNLVGSVAGILICFLGLAAMPVIVKTYEHDGEDHATSLIGRLTRYYFILLLPSMTGLWVLRYRILSVVTSAKYVPAAKAVFPIALSMALVNIAGLPEMSFLLKKRTKMLLLPIGLAALLNIGLNFLLVPIFGYVGAAWVTLISYAVYFALVVYLGSRMMKWRVPWLALLRAATASGIMALSLVALAPHSPHGITGLLALIAAGTVIYLLALAAIGGVKKAEWDFVATHIKRFWT